jgi:negative modulator of initiation of replication
MKNIEIEDDLYAYIASQTQHIGESASQILRRLVMPDSPMITVAADASQSSQTGLSPIGLNKDSLFSMLEKSNLTQIDKMVERFLLILSLLHKVAGADFAKVLSISGRNRVYFAKDKDTLLQTGSSTNPKAIPESEFWVITNNNTAKKVAILCEVADVLGYSAENVNRIKTIFLPKIIE